MNEISKSRIAKFFAEYDGLKYLEQNITDAIRLIVSCAQKNKVLLCGNGGSAADCGHIAGELLKSFALARRIPDALKERLESAYGFDGSSIAESVQQGVMCIPLTSFEAFNTAFLNDCNEKMLFAQLVNVLGSDGDILMAISTSGNSKNVCYAAQLARVKGLKIISLTGGSGGKLKELSDILINVPGETVYKIQEFHLPVYHLICLCVESELFE
ncbi:MAG: SIS domain-containing protein [Clostridiales bacterium]|jgi:D-sedoheptulose 7-phosphate isomerase|nr:SIS domain-containing protein [Clostridiales bacterium]